MPCKYKKSRLNAKKGLSTAEKASKALTLVNKLKNTSEIKWDTQTVTQNSNWSAAQWSFLNDLPEGTGPSGRIGEQIRVKSLDLRMQFRPAGTGALKFPVRLIIFREYDGATIITPANMFIGGVGSTFAHLKPFNPTYQHDYKILYDRTFNPDGSFEFPAYRIKLDIDSTVKFNSAGSVEPVKNSLRAMLISGANPGTPTDLTAVDMYWMLKYTDY